MFETLTGAFAHFTDLFTLLLLSGGVLLGLLFGIIPGLTATLAVILLVPMTYGMSAVASISVLIGVYIGGISGGLVSAILLGMPGTPSSITTAFDGFPLAKQGKARKALTAGIAANLVGTLTGWSFLVAIAPQLARLALQFGPFEYVAVILFGLTTVISLSGGSIFKGCIVGILGLAICTIGMDPITGMPRNTFGLDFLSGGINAVPAMIGLFVVAEVFRECENQAVRIMGDKLRVADDSRFTWQEFIRGLPNLIRSSLIGVGIGILPGIGGSLANFVAYDQAKKASPEPESFGKGNIQGVLASESANNAVIGGALIPMLALGIPGDVVSAALMGGLQLHGLEPGPLLFTENPQFVSAVYIAFLINAILMFVFMMLMGNRILPKLLLVPKKYLLPIVLVASTVGCYNLGYSIVDMWTAVVFGVVGYVMGKCNYPVTPMIISLVLGKMLEKQLRLALLMGKGSLLPLFTHPLCLLFIILALLSLFISFRRARRGA
ncbi:MAG: tripartite tricarboxylate transporter permease [Desulfovibrio sp.]|uniref:tripartite tricarboxylate transporter permease n=1 Tax=Desulfovibrio sp. TaxID=885 RepID=UPI0025C57131|nr:tripartite tricarboxylate transporter permease [Desulfovibrio sp.]MBS6830380.1 tripartite tricarboxylate transporter permease [Desulfovibrio sp.]